MVFGGNLAFMLASLVPQIQIEGQCLYRLGVDHRIQFNFDTGKAVNLHPQT